MFWADRIAQEVMNKFGPKGPMVIRDEKTVSGRVHVGSMRGVAIHGAVHEALTDRGVANTFLWEHNDFDPMDDIPVYLDRAMYEPHLGKPLYTIPSPDPSAANYGEYFAKEFQSVIESTGWTPQFVWARELYLSGKMDSVIRLALEKADDVRRIMKEVSGAERKPGWLPISVICPQCGKMTTTDATDFDGETVQVSCYETKVTYTKGCGWSGRVSPFGGKAKLYWKTDWPAKWKVYGVMVEGGGKDHSTKGGSRDVGKHIAKEVYGYDEPFDIPYEFFLVGGKKMSSSKGRGSSAAEIAALVPPKILRLALLGKDINQAINFDPEGDTIPVLYDQYDKLAENFWTGTKDDYARLFEMIHPGRDIPKKSSLPRFSQVAFLVQMPHMDLQKEFPDADRAELAERALYAKRWLEEYAPEKYVFKLQDTLPAVEITNEQKTNLKQILEFLTANPEAAAEELHAKLHELKAFKEIYLAFLGKNNGPKAGWFLSVLPRDFVLARLREAAQ
ncbi:lysine--tRNA ligase [Candidatus Kaiserbacteria bacterium]|nr:lysine--tRNA ligase [Candidatus Kaiserbacteria bacterium]